MECFRGGWTGLTYTHGLNEQLFRTRLVFDPRWDKTRGSDHDTCQLQLNRTRPKLFFPLLSFLIDRRENAEIGRRDGWTWSQRRS
jgi:hypothetical protein